MEIFERILESGALNKFKTIISSGKLSHAYFITGESENSLKEFSKALAMLLICENSSACGLCVNCKKIKNNFHPDVFYYPEGKNFVVADAESIIENVQIRPLEARYKIIIINRIDISTIQAQNKILKTLEDAPQNVIFIINAVNANAVLPTIKSRTQLFEIEDFTADSLESSESYQFLVKMLKEMTSSKKIIDFANQFAEKADFKNKINFLGIIFEKILHAKLSEQTNELTELGEQFEIGAIGEIFKLLTNAKKQLEANVNSNFITDNLLFKILEVKYLWNKNK